MASAMCAGEVGNGADELEAVVEGAGRELELAHGGASAKALGTVQDANIMLLTAAQISKGAPCADITAYRLSALYW
jgi:hypothetical protein